MTVKGWHKTDTSHKLHYFRAGKSVCLCRQHSIARSVALTVGEVREVCLTCWRYRVKAAPAKGR